jgi:hypothetical protein
MTTFTLTLDLADHGHPGSAQPAKVCEMLRVAIQAIGSDYRQRAGELTIPSFDPHRNVGGHVKIGSWEFTETRNPDAEV